jgi:hypothetical protein
MKKKRNEYQLAGYANYCGDHSIGFALPLFTNREDSITKLQSSFYIQVPNLISTAIAEFLRVEEQLVYHKIENQLEVAVGEPLIYVFIRKDGQVCSGSLENLKPQLHNFSKSNAQYPEILMQIADLVGNNADQVDARKSFMGTLKNLAPNTQTSRSFLVSDIRNWVWQKLIASQNVEKIKPDVFNRLKSVQVELTPELKINIASHSIGTWSDDLIVKLIEEANMFYSKLLVGLGDIEKNKQSMANPNRFDVNSLLMKFRSGGNQTLRLAILMEHIFLNPEYYQIIIESIQADRAILANEAVRRLRHTVSLARFSGSDIDKLLLLNVSWSALSRGTSGLKADYLYYLTRRLPSDPVVNRFVFAKLAASSSFIYSKLGTHLIELGYASAVKRAESIKRDTVEL